MYAKLKPISPGKRPQGSPPGKGDTPSQLLNQERAAARREAVANETRASISAFEASLRQSAMPVSEEQPRPFTTGDIPTGASSIATAQATQTAVSGCGRDASFVMTHLSLSLCVSLSLSG